MSLGGGTFITQNKILPGTYINFISAARANAVLSARGVATIPLVLDWGALGEVVPVTTGDMQKSTMKLFGREYTADVLRPMREIFKSARLCYVYRLGTGGAKATNDYGTARYVGTRGNALTVVVQENIDDGSLTDVTVLLDGVVVGMQTAAAAGDLVDDNYVVYNKSATLDPTAGTPMTGGTNPAVSNADYQTYLDAVESYAFNAIGCPSADSAVKGLFTAFTKRLRDEQGVKFQCVAHDNAADYEGVVNVMNGVTDAGADPYALIYWATGVIAGTDVNKSATNKVYDGEYTVGVNYTQMQLEAAIKAGKFALHRVGDDVRVLTDINSLVNVTLEKGEIFKANQTVRVLDQIANDIAAIFNTRYLGVVPNDDAGRVSLWADIVKHHEQLEDIRAIEDFDGEDVTVERGDSPKSVVVGNVITPVNAMEQLYMVVVVG
jgi:hypothetical protein